MPEQFSLQPGENIIRTCRVSGMDDLRYFVRITNQRLVFSPIEYPFLPMLIAGLIEVFARPKAVAHSWQKADIRNIEIRKKSSIPLLKHILGTKMIITVNGEDICLKHYDKRIIDWWRMR